MKKVFFLFSVWGILSSCSSTGPVPGEEYSISFHPSKGEKFQQRVMTRMEMEQGVSPNSAIMTQELSLTTDYEVLGNENGNTRLRSTYSRVKVSISSPNGDLTFDSEDSIPKINPGTVSFASMVDASFEMVMSPTGRVVSFSGLDQMISKMVDNIGAGPQREELKASLQEQYSDENFRKNVEFSWAVYPEKKVAVGESWIKEIDLGGGFPVKSSNNYSLESVGSGKAKIRLKGTVGAMGEKATGAKNGPGGIKLSGQQEGVISIDLASGWVTGMEISQEIKGEMDFGGTQIPIKIKTTAKIE